MCDLHCVKQDTFVLKIITNLQFLVFTAFYMKINQKELLLVVEANNF